MQKMQMVFRIKLQKQPMFSRRRLIIQLGMLSITGDGTYYQAVE